MNIRDLVVPAFFAFSGCATTNNNYLEPKFGVYQEATYYLYEVFNDGTMSRTLDVTYDNKNFRLYDKDGDGSIDSVSTKVLGIELIFDINSEKISEKTRRKIKELYAASLSN